MTVVVACTDGSTELVAVTDTGKLTRGVPWVPEAPRHPANANTASKPTKNIPMRSLAFALFRPPANIPTNPNSGSGNSRTAYTGAVFPGPHGRAEADPAVVAMVVFTVPVSGSCKDGLSMPNVQVAPNGSPAQAKLRAPKPGLEATTAESVVMPPGGTTAAPTGKVITIGGPMCVGSLAVWLFGSPPPETLALLVTFAGMLIGTFTVSVMAG